MKQEFMFGLKLLGLFDRKHNGKYCTGFWVSGRDFSVMPFNYVFADGKTQSHITFLPL